MGTAIAIAKRALVFSHRLGDNENVERPSA